MIMGSNKQAGEVVCRKNRGDEDDSWSSNRLASSIATRK